MKQHFLLFILLFICLPACKEDSTIILEGIEVLELPTCDDYVDITYRIEDAVALDVLFQQIWNRENCEEFQFPFVDFEERTLLGFETVQTTCENIYEHEVTANPEEKVYELNISVRPNEECTETEVIMHWLSIPKVPADYQVRYSYSEI